jgi:superfamily II DNA or RNA helicase
MVEISERKITLFPTRIVIEPYEERNSKIENSFSVWNEVTHSYDFQAFIKDEINNRLIIPTSYTKNELKLMYPTYQIVDRRNICESYMNANRRVDRINMKYDFKNDLQKKALDFLNKKENIRHLYRPMQRYLCLKTGDGKTYCAVRYIVDNCDRPIIFVDQDSLGQQWKERILEYTDTKEEEIYYISGTPSINKLMEKDDSDILKIKFFICCYRTLTNNIKNTNNSNLISSLFNKIKITLKIFDEAHIEYRSIFKIDMISNIRSIYLSATPKRSDPKEDKVYQKIFYNVKKFFSDSVEKEENYHNIILYNWNSKPSLTDQTKCSTKYGFSMARYCSYLEENKYDQFEEFLYEIIFKTVLANRKKKKMAILFGTLSLLDKFYNNLVKYVSDQGYKLTVNKFTGNTDKKEKLDILETTDIILTTDKSFSKGMDVKNLQVLINTVPFSSDTKLIQVVGRLRKIPDKEVIFIDVNDFGFDAIKWQTNSKKKVYEVLAKNLFIKNK